MQGMALISILGDGPFLVGLVIPTNFPCFMENKAIKQYIFQVQVIVYQLMEVLAQPLQALLL